MIYNNSKPDRLATPRKTASAGGASSLGQALARLGGSGDSLRALLREGSSPNTQAAYLAAIRYWEAWHALRLGRPFSLPLPVAAVLQFIADHLEHSTAAGLAHDLPEAIDRQLVASGAKRAPGPLKLSTVRHRLAVLSEAHETQALPNPCRDHAVRTLMQRSRAAYARRGDLPQGKDALTREPLEQLLATCDDTLIGLRDRAMLLFAWASGGRRRSEVVAATLENLRRTPEGYLYVLAHSKTNQEGRARPDIYKPVAGRAAQALDAWLAAAGITHGALFRRVRRGGIVGEALGAEALRRMVQARARQAGLDGNYAAHSLRAGFITEAGRQGLPLAEVMAMSGHASVATVMHYHRAGAAVSSRAARLLDED
ncbi:site-specific integrase [Bordetella hinzii]|uniref:site-specific integrase n=1 Tax=Bordetella hinzii TaxID=103855 RepID=UPI00067198C0|nr:site-specific integrase [Bordetella hinzii]AKQ60331.1 site-specific tyrosine recombinase XerC [Bordetella hinzii]